jgi:two-component system NarL family sensor kinase
MTPRGRHPRLALGLTLLAVATAIAVAAASTDASEWRPASLLLVLAGFAIASELLPIEVRPRSQELRGWYFSSSAPFVLVATCLGAGPALVVAFAALAVSTAVERTPWRYALANAGNHGLFTVTAAVLAETARRAFDIQMEELGFAVLVVAAYVYTLLLNLALTAGYGALADGESIPAAAPALWRGLLAAEAPLIVLTGFTAYGYGTSGLVALVVLAGVQLWFVRGARELHRSVDRADHIAELSASRNRLVEQILTAEESERRRLADALHDGAVQNLLAARQDLAEPYDLCAVASAKSAIDSAVEQLREEISELHPSVLAHVGLKAALESLVATQARRGGFEANVELDGSVPAQLETLTFTVCRELVVNAAKHSQAEQVTVRVRSFDGYVAIETSDDGCGFAERSFGAALDRGHIGLASVSERVEALGGRFNVDSRPGAGTHVTAFVPATSPGMAMWRQSAEPTRLAPQMRTEISA